MGSFSELHNCSHGMYKGSFDGIGFLIILFDLRNVVNGISYASKKFKLLVLFRINALDVVGNLRKKKICQIEILDWAIFCFKLFEIFKLGTENFPSVLKLRCSIRAIS